MTDMWRRTTTLVLVLTARSAAAEPPRDWIVRASPGFGYSWDGASGCRLRGQMWVGGFSGEYEVASRLFVGAATTILFNVSPEDGTCGADGSRLTQGVVVGPSLEWYPSAELGLHGFALAGYAELDPDDVKMHRARGVGTTLGVGYDWRRSRNDHGILFGARAQVTLATTSSGHDLTLPSLVMTVGFD